ncbi:PTS system, beta-glucosides-specific IIC component [Evansella caseinilytica]|uniref:PTS system, beta-glucosides-specific IIC component n=1 Tax=Evansella caseinilytica TaxID=1503961 RepID=A0A1H3U4D8_9BACI|nr:PTS transporter subunit EIIC [Evansella caseinilytica]SDZ57320.1 PTS system, beta-glucosides-specific IIC component [Evansella caseinilytica]
MEYQNLAKEILKEVGGVDNVKHLTHCATRLRFTLIDAEKVDQKIKDVKGILGVVNSGGQFQIIIGQDVAHVYNELTPLLKDQTENTTGAEQSAEETPEKKESVISRLLGTISGIFTPILPAITGAAMLKTLLIVLTMTNVIATESQTYAILNFASDAAFYFLPVMLAFSAANKFKMNPMMAVSLGGILLHPTFTAMVAEGNPVHFLGIPVSLVTYGSSVIPIILVVWIASYVERFADRVTPKSVRFFMKPLITLLVMTPVALIFIAPLGNIAGTYVAVGINFINSHAVWVLPLIFGIFGPIFIMMGMHYAVTIPIVMQSITTHGFDMIGAGFLVANIAQGAAAFAVARQVKNNPDFKVLANSAGFTALLGITEPAIYGVNLKLKKPFYAVLIAGGVAGLFVGLMGVKRLALAPTGLLTLPVFLDPSNALNIVYAIIGAVISFVLAYVLTTIFLKKSKEGQNNK